ncbi:MAG: DUF2203 family protein [Myxococcota bacterium]|nr:DUF2203 family protein [Myxococcota bacterium]
MQTRRTRERYFTPAEANAALPALRAAAEAARTSSRERQDLLDRLRGDRELLPHARRSAAREAERLRQEVHMRLDEIAEAGAEVVGLRSLRIAFPALRDGLEVALDWKEGEPRVVFWRPPYGDKENRNYIISPESSRWTWSH